MRDGLIAGVEGGGTKFIAAVAQPTEAGAPSVIERLRVDTTHDPAATLRPISAWLERHEVTALGIATFGPLDLESGTVRATPKPGWSGADVLGLLTSDLEPSLPAGFDTDVNGAGFGEWRWGAARGASVALYLTVGTGIGGGAIVQGRPLHGLGHPEMGHISVRRVPSDETPSTCTLHTDCLEGVASGPAMQARAGRPPSETPIDDPVWDIEADYLAQGLTDLTLVLSPEVIVIGGGVMQHPGLLDRVADRLDATLGGYVATPRVTSPHFGQEAGLYGALALALDAVPP